jgi:Formylmethanofuran dehydrogenase subunit E
MTGQGTEQDSQRFHELMAGETQRVLNASDEELFKIEEVELDFPVKARLFSSITCSVCGEQVMEPRARVRGGNPVCIPCSDEYPSRI